MSRNSGSREREEKNERKGTINSDVSDSRYQNEQQLAPSMDANEVKPNASSFTAKEITPKGSSLKTEKVADVIVGSGAASGMGISGGGKSVSGTGGGILGNLSSTPQAEKSRSDSRLGKKLDRTSTKMNYTPAERAILKVDESKPLADAASDDQGYNGTYRNLDARSQKIAGGVPADLMFQRSVDLITKDRLYFTEGQMIEQKGVKYNEMPTKSVTMDSTPDKIKYDTVNYSVGNFIHKAFHFDVDEAGHVTSFYADVDDISTVVDTPEQVNQASAARLIKNNRAELDRMRMDEKAGDEKADIWTDLARAIEQPTRTSFLLSTYEGQVGAYTHLSYSKATTNASYYLNRTAKDGLDDVVPAIEEVVGWRSNHDMVDRDDFLNTYANNGEDKGIAALFDTAHYRAGDPSLMIALYDSPRKYTSKADFILQPRGFRMHYQTADNNMNPLKCFKQYAKTYNAMETFSTIDHEYDPLLPICMTDKANLILTTNLNEHCGFIEKNYCFDNFDMTITFDTLTEYESDPEKSEIVTLPVNKMVGRLDHSVGIFAKKYAKAGDINSTALTLAVDDDTDPIIWIDEDDPQAVTGNEVCKINVKAVIDPTDDDIADLESAGYALVRVFTPEEIVNDGIRFMRPIPQPDSPNNSISAYVESTPTQINNGTLYYRNGGVFSYSYSDLRNNYVVHVYHPLVFGLIKYIENGIGSKLHTLLKRDHFYLPLVFSTQYATLASLMICAATPWIARVRQNSMVDVIYYEDNIKEYPYPALDSLRNVPFKSYQNFNYVDYDSPLETKIMSPVLALTWTMPEMFVRLTDHAIMLPYYFNEDDFTEVEIDEDTLLYDTGDHNSMSMPSIRYGARMKMLDDFYGVSEKDIRLAYDRLTNEFITRIARQNSKILDVLAYKYGITTDGQIVLANMDENVEENDIVDVSIHTYLSAPRELGLSMECPAGYLSPIPGVSDNGGMRSLNDTAIDTSYCITLWHNAKADVDPAILSKFAINIERGQNYIQYSAKIPAVSSSHDQNFYGLVFGTNDDPGYYLPFIGMRGKTIDSAVVNHVERLPLIHSDMRSMNTRVQFLPFIISPFDATTRTEMSGTRSIIEDIFTLGYVFGLCGFRASDYRESVYNREKEIVNQGLLFVQDPWVAASPIVKEGAVATGLPTETGYKVEKV